jgi:hypothetical protein
MYNYYVEKSAEVSMNSLFSVVSISSRFRIDIQIWVETVIPSTSRDCILRSAA